MARALKWTKLEERKPRNGQRCLVLVGETGHIHDAWYFTRWAYGFCTGKDNGQSVRGVTQWIPYPR